MEVGHIIQQIESTLDMLYLNKPEANQELVTMIDLLGNVGENYDIGMQEFSAILEKALEAMEYGDTVLLCDVLEYNLLPFLRNTSNGNLRN